MAKKSPPPAPKKPTKAEKAAAAPTEKDVQNGVTRPKDGTTSAKVWALAEKHGDRAGVLAAAEKIGINSATATTQFGKWRAYNGITGRKPSEPKSKAPTKAKTSPKPPAPPSVDEDTD